MKDVDRVKSMSTTEKKTNKEVFQQTKQKYRATTKGCGCNGNKKCQFTTSKQILDYQDVGSNYNLAENYIPSIQERKWFHPRWARRPKHSHLYGTNYIDEFKNDLIKMFDV